VRLDGNPALALQIHVVQDLLLHFVFADSLGYFEETIGEGGLAVIDMSDYAEIADGVFFVHRTSLSEVVVGAAQHGAKIQQSLLGEAGAGYLKDWNGPAEGERPTAYVVILGDTSISGNSGCDHGIAAQTILLGATEKGLGGCMIGSVKRAELQKTLAIDTRFEVLLVIALGKPAEKVVIEEAAQGSDVKYWRDEQGVHHVPKRKLGDIIVN
jgi:hypothetical protein